MSSITVRTVEELGEARWKRVHRIIMVEGELATNLLASGIIRSSKNKTGWQVTMQKGPRPAHRSPMGSVFDILRSLSRHYHFKVVQGALGKRIRIEPVQEQRREGN